MQGNCSQCGALIAVLTGYHRNRIKQGKRVYCAPACRFASTREEISARMAATNRKYASARMKANNPMHRDDNLERMRNTLKSMGHRPPWQGGNGRGLTVPQGRLLAALGDGWVAEHSVRTYAKRGTLPGALKVDLAHPERKIAVEVDGYSHGLKRVQSADAAKEAFLTGHGWTVLRFTNQQVMDDTEGCARTVWSTTSRLRESIPTSPTGS